MLASTCPEAALEQPAAQQGVDPPRCKRSSVTRPTEQEPAAFEGGRKRARVSTEDDASCTTTTAAFGAEHEELEVESPALDQAAPSQEQHVLHWRRQEGLLYPCTAQLWALQDDVTPHMRQVLIRWLIDVCRRFKLARETLFLTINYMDRFLAARHVSRPEFQLLGVACLWVAGKYEEVRAPTCKQLLHMTGNAYSVQQLCKMEGDLLAALNFELGTPTSLKFLDWLLALDPAAADLPTSSAAAAANASVTPCACTTSCGADVQARACGRQGCTAPSGSTPVRQLAVQLLEVAALSMNFGPVLSQASAPATPTAPPCPKAAAHNPVNSAAAANAVPLPSRQAQALHACSPASCSGSLFTPLPSSSTPSSSSPDSVCSASTPLSVGPASASATPIPATAPAPSATAASPCLSPPSQRAAGAKAGSASAQQPASHVAAGCLLAARSMLLKVSREDVAVLAARVGCEPGQLLHIAQDLCSMAAASRP